MKRGKRAVTTPPKLPKIKLKYVMALVRCGNFFSTDQATISLRDYKILFELSLHSDSLGHLPQLLYTTVRFRP